MTRKQKRLSVIGGGLFVLAVAAALVLFALQQKIAFFRMPSDIQTSDVESESRFRLGGLDVQIEAGFFAHRFRV